MASRKRAAVAPSPARPPRKPSGGGMPLRTGEVTVPFTVRASPAELLRWKRALASSWPPARDLSDWARRALDRAATTRTLFTADSLRNVEIQALLDSDDVPEETRADCRLALIDPGDSEALADEVQRAKVRVAAAIEERIASIRRSGERERGVRRIDTSNPRNT